MAARFIVPRSATLWLQRIDCTVKGAAAAVRFQILPPDTKDELMKGMAMEQSEYHHRMVSLEELVRCDEPLGPAEDGSNGYYKPRVKKRGKRKAPSKFPRRKHRPSAVLAPAGGQFDREDGVPTHLRKLGICESDLIPRVPLCSMAPVVARCIARDTPTVTAAYARFLQEIGVNPHGRARCLLEIDAIHDAFFDWFAYDYTYEDGTTPLENFLMENAAGIHQLTHERVKALWSVLNCSIEGGFLVERVCAFAGITILRSLKDGFSLAVEDPAMSFGLLGCENTFIAGRFTQFGAAWRPSSRPFHIPTPYRTATPGAIDDETSLIVQRHRLELRSARRESLGGYANRTSCGTLLIGVPDAYVPDPVNSASVDWFMASGTFDINQFRQLQALEEAEEMAIQGSEGLDAEGLDARRADMKCTGETSDGADGAAEDERMGCEKSEHEKTGSEKIEREETGQERIGKEQIGKERMERGQAGNGQSGDNHTICGRSGSKAANSDDTTNDGMIRDNEGSQGIESKGIESKGAESKGAENKGTHVPDGDSAAAEFGTSGMARSGKATTKEKTTNKGAKKAETKKAETRRGKAKKTEAKHEEDESDDERLIDLSNSEDFWRAYARMPLMDCVNEHGHICNAEDKQIASLDYLQLLWIVFSAPDEKPYNQHGYESRDYTMICNELLDMGVMIY